jgi:hypothetical protein
LLPIEENLSAAVADAAAAAAAQVFAANSLYKGTGKSGTVELNALTFVPGPQAHNPVSLITSAALSKNTKE